MAQKWAFYSTLTKIPIFFDGMGVFVVSSTPYTP